MPKVKIARIFILISILLFAAIFIYGQIINKDKQKILLICLDGATWNIMEPLIESGQLPNFSKLVKEGVSGKLLANPAYSPSSWTSIATGKGEEKHGVHNFSDAKNRKARYVWDILEDYDIKPAVINWLMTIPYKMDKGIIFADAWFAKIENHCYSENFEKKILKKIKMIELPPFQAVEIYKFLESSDKNIMNVCRYFMNNYHPQFLAIGFMGTNPFQHRYWSALEPRYFDISLREVEEKGNLITDYYKKIDKYLDYFIKHDYTIIFVSDHGFCRSDARSGPRIIKYYQLASDMQHLNFLVNQMLEKLGLLVFIPKMEGGQQIDFANSKAYFYNNIESGSFGVKINKKIVTEAEAAGLKSKIYRILTKAHFEDGSKVFLDVQECILNKDKNLASITFKLNPIFKKEGIVFETSKTYSFDSVFHYYLNKDGKKLFKVIIADKKYDLGEFINYSRDGVHESEGVVIIRGKNIIKNKHIEGARTIDITPTILYLSGLAIAKDMDGRVLFDAINPEFNKIHPLKFIETYEKGNIPVELNDNSNIVADRERLMSLGYAQ